jgi:15-cis-phytoene synthase
VLNLLKTRRVSDAETYCRDMARREAKNFYWGFISLPYEQRIAIYALYDFAREVDDEADAGAELPDLPGRLQRHRERIYSCVRGDFEDPVMEVLASAVDRYAIPARELNMLIDGVEMDFSRNRYATWEDLLEYCNLVASVVGRMCVRIFGFDEEVALERADDLGVALQLTNILRDVREDAGMGRIYLPLEDLARFGISPDAVLAGDPGDRWPELVAFESARAREYFESGYRVLRYIPRRPAACVQTMAGIYERILTKVERDPQLPLRERAALAGHEKLGVMVRSWLRAG